MTDPNADNTPSKTPDEALSEMMAGGEDAFDLAEAALWLAARDTPNASLASYINHLKSLYEAVEEEAIRLELDDQTATPEQLAQVLTAVISTEYRYSGDEETYEDLDNANMMRVIDRRKGLPVTLGILYIAVAKAQGWNAAGLNFPGHFLVRLEGLDGSRAIIDPFHNGQILDPPALRDLLKVVAGQAEELESKHYRPVGYRDILLRLQNNVKTRRLDVGQLDEALDALKSMQVLLPDSTSLHREAGLLHLRLGQLSEALTSLQQYVAHAPQGLERSRIETVVRDLKQRIH